MFGDQGKIFTPFQGLNYKAFCHELDREVEAAEIWEIMFGEKIFNDTLTFKCPDPLCDAKLITRNCFAYVEPEEASFRLYPRSKHCYGCTYSTMKRLSQKKKAKNADMFSNSMRTKRNNGAWL